MHVLFLADGLFPFVVGGMQKHSTMLIKHLSPLVDQITVCTCGEANVAPTQEQDILEELITSKDNIQVFTCSFEDYGRLPGHYLRANRKLSRTFLKLAGDLSQYDWIYAQGLTGDAFLKKHPKVLVNLHGLNMFQPSYSWKEEIGKRMMRPVFAKQIRKAWKVVSLGGKLSDILVTNGAKKEQVVVLPNGVDDFWFDSPKSNKKTDGIRFLMVGRNDPVKGFSVLLEALQLLDEPIEVHFVGNWPEIESTHHNLTYHGVVRDKCLLKDVMDSCDVLLLPSLSEGMPTVILEAAARGVVSVASDVGAVSEIVPPENLFEPGSVKSLKEMIQKIQSREFFPGKCRSIRFEEVAELTLRSLKG